MILLIDNYDSFTYNLRDYVRQCGAECRVIRNDEMSLDEIAAIPFRGAILSPGPHTPAQAGITLSFIRQFAASKPMLGICLGHQAIGQFFGMPLVKAVLPMHGKTSLIQHSGHWLFKNVRRVTEVMRYHSLILAAGEQSPLSVIATTAAGEIMAIAHPDLPITGIQFHPESVGTPDGLQMIRNWLDSLPPTN